MPKFALEEEKEKRHSKEKSITLSSRYVHIRGRVEPQEILCFLRLKLIQLYQSRLELIQLYQSYQRISLHLR